MNSSAPHSGLDLCCTSLQPKLGFNGLDRSSIGQRQEKTYNGSFLNLCGTASGSVILGAYSKERSETRFRTNSHKRSTRARSECSATGRWKARGRQRSGHRELEANSRQLAPRDL